MGRYSVSVEQLEDGKQGENKSQYFSIAVEPEKKTGLDERGGKETWKIYYESAKL